MDIEKIAKAIEADAGEPLPELRQALREAAERKGRVTTPEQMLVRVARAPLGDHQQRLRKPPASR